MSKTDVKMQKGWPDEILQLERVGDEHAGYYYLALVVELEQEGALLSSRFTGNTPDEAIDQALEAISNYEKPHGSARAVESQIELIDAEIDTLAEEQRVMEHKLTALVETRVARRTELRSLPVAPPSLKAYELLEEVDMIKLAAKWLDPEMKRGFKRLALRPFKDLDDDGDMDDIVSWYR